jgi:DNA-binding PadR family transcriptional regulator
MSKPTTILQGTLDLLILSILKLEPKTGWALSQRLRQMSNETLQVSHGSLYPPESGRPSKLYSLTPAGETQLRTEAENWNRISSAVNAIVEPAS